MTPFKCINFVACVATALTVSHAASASILPQTAQMSPMIGFGIPADDTLLLSRRGRGADDPAGHIRGGKGEHPAGHAALILAPEAIDQLNRRGADDPAGHIRGGKGEHPAGHAALILAPEAIDQLNRRGADDPAGHIRGGKGEHPAGHAALIVGPSDVDVLMRRGRGKDDPVGHG